jgi:hypothetical protein
MFVYAIMIIDKSIPGLKLIHVRKRGCHEVCVLRCVVTRRLARLSSNEEGHKGNYDLKLNLFT